MIGRTKRPSDPPLVEEDTNRELKFQFRPLTDVDFRHQQPRLQLQADEGGMTATFLHVSRTPCRPPRSIVAEALALGQQRLRVFVPAPSKRLPCAWCPPRAVPGLPLNLRDVVSPFPSADHPGGCVATKR